MDVDGILDMFLIMWKFSKISFFHSDTYNLFRYILFIKEISFDSQLNLLL